MAVAVVVVAVALELVVGAEAAAEAGAAVAVLVHISGGRVLALLFPSQGALGVVLEVPVQELAVFRRCSWGCPVGEAVAAAGEAAVEDGADRS